VNGRTADLERHSWRSGQVAGVLYGVCLIMTSIMLYVLGVYLAVEFEDAAMMALAIPATAIVVFGRHTVSAGINMGGGTLTSDHILRVVISYLVMIIASTIVGLIFEVQLEAIWGVPGVEVAPRWAAIATLTGSVFLIITAHVYRNPEARIAAGIMAIIGVGVLIVGGLELLHVPLLYGVPAGPMPAEGVVTLTVAAWALAAIGALLYSVLTSTRHKPIPYLVLTAGFLLYGIALAIAGFTNVSDSMEFARLANWAIPLVLTTVLTGIAGVAFVVASSLAMTTMGLPTADMSAASAEPFKCPDCGSAAKSGQLFCRSCGAELPKECPIPVAKEGKQLCANCGTPGKGAMRFCSKCGTELT